MKQKRASEYIMLSFAVLLSSAVLILLSTNTSFLYRNCYLELNGSDAIRNMVAAKHLVKDGLLPYKDLYTTSGLPVYLWMAIGYLIHGEEGILFIQILSLALSLILIDRILGDESVCGKLMGMSLFLLVSLACYSTGAGSVEFIHPFLLYSIWYITTEDGASENHTLSLRDYVMAAVAIVLIMTNLFLGIGALLAMNGRHRCSERRSIWMLFLAALFLLLAVLAAAGMLVPWLNMFREYYIPTFRNQLYPTALLYHRMVKMAPSCLIPVAAFFTTDRSKRVYYVIAWLMAVLYLISGEEAWFRYGIIAPYLPVCFKEIVDGTKQSSRISSKLAFLCFLSLAVYFVPLKHMVQNYQGEVVNRHYMEEVDGIRSWNSEENSEGILCLDTSAKYYLLLDKVPVNRYYTRQSELSVKNEAIASYMYDYLWNDEYKGDIFLYHSSDGWCPESINHYQWITVSIFSEYVALYEWTDEIIEDSHEHEADSSESADTDDISEWEGLE